ncbi:MAG: SPOR domain-containing protein [Chlorobi bacterium]|nr:SPOR domain-containing protein [Chlorobiota bacterium]
MDLSPFIKDLLFEHEYVIVPGLGAFVSNYKPAYLDEGKNVYFPPSKEITFNSKLKNNDRLLVDYLIEKTGIREYAAVKNIETFREEVQYRLDNGERIEIKGLGFLYTDDKQTIMFESAPAENLLRDSYGLQAVSLSNNKEASLTGVVADKKEDKVARKRKKAWVWLLIIPIVITGIFIYLNILYPPATIPPIPPPTTKGPLPGNSTALIDSAQAVSDSIVEQDTVVPEIKPAAETAKYYLIGGSFKEQGNADKFFNRVSRKGYKPIHMGQQGNFFIVAIGEYSNSKDAISAKKEFLEKEPGSGVWILVGK